jgi:hypothetical protein
VDRQVKFQASAARLRPFSTRNPARTQAAVRPADHVENFVRRWIHPNLHAGVAGLQPGGYRLDSAGLTGPVMERRRVLLAVEQLKSSAATM